MAAGIGSLHWLREYKPELTRRDDFFEFWEETKLEAERGALDVHMDAMEYPVSSVQVYSVQYAGFRDSPITAWYIVPKGASRRDQRPAMVNFHGYGWNKMYVHMYLKWVLQGYIVLAVDCRGQSLTCPDTAIYPGGNVPGYLTKGVLDKYDYYYKNVYMDCYRAVNLVFNRDEVDATRICAFGSSQGGGLSLVTAALNPRVSLCMAEYPFLCHFERACELSAGGPYTEINEFFRFNDPKNDLMSRVFDTLSYFDCMNFAGLIKCPTLMSVGLADVVCPPSTIFAVYNHLECEKEMIVYPHFGHETIWQYDDESIRFANQHFGIA